MQHIGAQATPAREAELHKMIDRLLPGGAKRTGVSPSFDSDNLPKKLLSDHQTAAGVYGRLNVMAGSLTFVSALEGEPARQLSAGQHHIILPEESHRVEPGAGMQFEIEFFRVVSG